MTLENAIELSKEASESLKAHKFPDHADAITLLIEAARRILKERLTMNDPDWGHLPSETIN